MPRNISCAMNVPEIKNRTKTVTRRCGWWFLKSGEPVWVVEKSMGLKKDEKVKRLALVEVVETRKEPLCNITKDDCVREGFPNLSPDQFVAMFCQANNCTPDTEINRIEFKYIGELR